MSTVNSATAYRVLGPVVSFAELQEKCPACFMKIPDDWLEQQKRAEAQDQANLEAIDRYAREHPAKVYGQVVVDGELFATVWDSGSAQFPYPIPGLTDSAGSPLEIAKARLRELAEASGGEVRYSNFLPLPGGGEYLHAVIPDSFLASLPKVPLRPLSEVLEEMLASQMHSHVESCRLREAEIQAASGVSETEAANKSM